jgi:hypothetical protein
MVIEFPIKTTRFSSGAGGDKDSFSVLKWARFGQSCPKSSGPENGIRLIIVKRVANRFFIIVKKRLVLWFN